MWTDVKFALRSFRRRPAAATLAVLTLAVGIAASTTMFTVADAILWHPLPFRDADRLVRLHSIATGQPSAIVPVQALDAWPSKDRVLSGLSTYALLPGLITGAGEPELATICEISSSAFTTLEIASQAGRVFAPADDRSGAEPVVVLSDAFWRQHFAGAFNAVGRTIAIDARQYVVGGIAPAGFQFPVDRVALWRPIGAGRTRVGAFARLAPGVTLQQAQAAADTIPRDLKDERGPLPRIQITPFMPVNARIASELSLLSGAVGLLLVIAVGNAGNVLLAEAVRRDAEMAVRVALGAGWRRLARPVAIEALLIAGTAAVAAALLSVWAVQSLVAAMPYIMHFSALRPIAVDWRALSFASVVALIAGVAAGIPSLMRAISADVLTATKGVRSVAGGHGRVRQALTVLQMAVAIVVLAAAGLLVNGSVRLAHVNPGFNADHVVQVSFYLPKSRFEDPAAAARWLDRVRQDAAALPGVADATISGGIPPRLGFRTSRLETPGGADTTISEVTLSEAEVDDHFFSTLGIPLLSGRTFDRRDTAPGASNAIVGEALARRLWTGGSAIGRRFRLSAAEPWLTVVGIVGNVQNGGFDSGLGDLTMYTPPGPHATAWGFTGLVVRTQGDPARVVAAVRDLLRRLDADVPIIEVQTAHEVAASTNARLRFATFLMAGFAAIALFLAVLGVYGTFWCAVRQREREIGVRAALGARPVDIIGLVLTESGRLALLGVAIGVPCALAAAQLTRTLLFGVSPSDPMTFVLACALLVVASLAAGSLPAYAASRIDPAVALRAD